MSNLEELTAIILAGGKGTRMREMTHDLPKPMVEIGGKPMLVHIMNLYAQYNHKDFIVALGYKGEIIKQYFSRSAHKWNVDLIDTGQTLNWIKNHFQHKRPESIKICCLLNHKLTM